jgi:hypothetical protein
MAATPEITVAHGMSAVPYLTMDYISYKYYNNNYRTMKS